MTTLREKIHKVMSELGGCEGYTDEAIDQILYLVREELELARKEGYEQGYKYAENKFAQHINVQVSTLKQDK